jgi:hypothetical protein
LAIGADKERVTAIVPTAIAKEIKRLAKKEKRSRSKMAEVLLELGLEAFKKQK